MYSVWTNTQEKLQDKHFSKVTEDFYSEETFILTSGVPEVSDIVMADQSSDPGKFVSFIRVLWSVSLLWVRWMCLNCRTVFCWKLWWFNEVKHCQSSSYNDLRLLRHMWFWRLFNNNSNIGAFSLRFCHSLTAVWVNMFAIPCWLGLYHGSTMVFVIESSLDILYNTKHSI